jgi:DNA polymerase-3 subunit delta'
MALLAQARAAGAGAAAKVEALLESELEYAIAKDHGRMRREAGERAKRAARRAQTAALDRGLALVGLWLRDVACVVDGAPELVHHSDRGAQLREDAQRGVSAAALRAGQGLTERTRADLALNPNEELALDALGSRLARALNGG